MRTTTILLDEIKKLSPKEQLRIAKSIYSNVEEVMYDTALTKEQNKILHERLEEYEAGKSKFISWEQVKKNLKNPK